MKRPDQDEQKILKFDMLVNKVQVDSLRNNTILYLETFTNRTHRNEPTRNHEIMLFYTLTFGTRHLPSVFGK